MLTSDVNNIFRVGHLERAQIASNLKRARGSVGARELARAAGISHASISQFEHALHEPAAGTLGRLAAAMRVSADYLLGLTDVSTPATKLERERSRLATELAARNARIRELEDADLSGNGSDPWPFPLREEAHSSAGPGAYVTNERAARSVLFRQDWARKHGLRPSHCDVLEVRGESMEPTLRSGAWILVDRHRAEPRDDKVFVVRVGDETFVKRLRRTRGGWRLASDNRDQDSAGRLIHPPQPFPPDGTIIGQVVWAGMWTGKTL